MNGCVPRGWSAENYVAAYALHCAGKNTSQIARSIGLSRFCVAGVRFRQRWKKPEIVAAAPRKKRRETRECLPAGHPDTWGLISHDGYPGL
jgi:hypothetical protein